MDIPNQEMHRVATTAIIFRSDGRVLILKRAEHKKQWPGKWTVPGGGLETDDYTTRPPTYTDVGNQWYFALHTSVRREVFEETGLEILKPWLVCDLTFIRNDGCPVLVLSYAADIRYDDMTVVLDDDAVQFAWVTLHEASKYDLIEGIYHELELAFAERFKDNRLLNKRKDR